MICRACDTKGWQVRQVSVSRMRDPNMGDVDVRASSRGAGTLVLAL
jgi:hypothetical protein